MIYLSEHQTIASQCAIPNAQNNLYWINCMYSITLLHWWLFLILYFTLKKIEFKTTSSTQILPSSQEGLAQYLIIFVH